MNTPLRTRAIRTRKAKGRIDYRRFAEVGKTEPVKLGDPDVYEVERVVTKRGKASETEFLILWKGFPKDAASWVRNADVTPQVIRSLNTPAAPTNDIIQDCVGRLTMTIDKSLRLGSSRHRSFNIEFRHDVYRYLWGDNTVLNFENFNNTSYFSIGWDQHYKYNDDEGHNYGTRIEFPIKTKLKVQYNPQAFYMDSDSKLINKKASFIELLYVKLKKMNC